MANLSTLTVKLVTDTADYQKGLDSASEKAKGFSSNLGSIFKGAGIAGIGVATAGIVGMGKALFDSVQAAADAQKVQTQTEAVLKSTGGSAGVTADMVSDLANKFVALTPIEDETVQSGENMLLTFTNIGKNVFPQATETMLDMSTALGQDVTASAMQLGKALNDPVQGVTALRRVGVQLTDSQQAMIKSMVDAGNVEGAQKIILQELQREFGGSAQAAGQTFAGSLEILKNQFGNLKEAIGGGLLPVLTKLMSGLTGYVTQATGIISSTGSMSTKVSMFGDLIGQLSGDIAGKIPGIVDKAVGLIQGIATGLAQSAPKIATALAQALTGAIGGIAEMGKVLIPAALQLIGALVRGLAQGAPQLGAQVGSLVVTIAQSLAANLSTIITGGVDLILGLIQGMSSALPQLIPLIPMIIMTIVSGLANMLPDIIRTGLVVIQSLGEGIIGALGLLSGMLPAVMKQIVGLLMSALPDIINTGTQVLTSLISGLIQALPQLVAMVPQIVVTIVSVVLENLPLIIQAAINLVVTLATTLIKNLPYIVGAAIELILGLVGALLNALPRMITAGANIIQAFIDGAKSLWTNISSLGGNIVSSIWGGIQAAKDTFLANVKGFFSNLIGSVKSALGIHSPSRVFAGIGSNLIQGLAAGLAATGPVEQAMSGLQGLLLNVPQPQLALAATGGYSAPAWATPAAVTGAGGAAAAPTGGRATAGSSNISITINNPVGEPSEESIHRQLRNLSYLGVMP